MAIVNFRVKKGLDLDDSSGASNSVAATLVASSNILTITTPTNATGGIKYNGLFNIGNVDTILDSWYVDAANMAVRTGGTFFVQNRAGSSTYATIGATATFNVATSITSTLAVTGNTTFTGDIAVNGGDITTTSTTVSVFDTTATTVAAFGAAQNLSFADSNATGANQTVTFATAATASGFSKNISIGTGGDAGSVTTINLGSNGNNRSRTYVYSRLLVDGNMTDAAWTTSGSKFLIQAATSTDNSTVASGSQTQMAVASILSQTFAATNTAVTYTNGSTFYIHDAPTAGTNVTITNPYAFYVNAGNSYLGGNLTTSGTITSSSTVQGTRLISTVTTGTAPLTVSSTTAVTNLNADLLDGQHGSYYATDSTVVHIAGTESITGFKTFTSTTAWQNGAGGKVIVGNDSTAGSIELGRTDGTASSPYIDFHSGAAATDFDARISAGGGNGSSGGGNITLTANGGIGLAGPVTISGAYDLTLNRNPSLALHAATKQYVDSIAAGLDPKESCRVATTANVTLAGGAPNTLDGVTLVAGDRILVKNQTTASQNGIYTVTTLGTGANGTWSRAGDFDGTPSNEVTAGAFTFIEEGTTYADTGWVLSTNNPITLGTTSLTFTQFSSAGIITASGALTKTGNNITHNTSGASAGTYNNVTVDTLGHVTGGSNVAYLTAEADTLATVTGRGATTASAISITNATASTSTSTGALVVTGGVGVGGTVYIGGDLSLAGGDLLGTATVNAFNTTTTTLNLGGAATTINIGAAGTTVNINATTASDAYTAGALVVDGGIGIAKDITVAGIVQERLNARGSISGAQTIDLTLGQSVSATITAATTFTVTNPPPTGYGGGFTLVLTNGGAFTITWMTGTKWAGGTAPTLTASGIDVLTFYTTDGGTTWRGALIIKDSR
ncbi:MAG: hypothetical protein QXN55_00175 [Candidatus Nitrosotenuis sp.]